MVKGLFIILSCLALMLKIEDVRPVAGFFHEIYDHILPSCLDRHYGAVGRD
jgi:hypothetical protein